MLSIKNLTASINGTPVLKGIDLEIKAGEIHAIMGPNGSGKSTLGKVLAGHPAYEVTGGEVLFEGQNLFEMDADARARAGLFMGFQHPIEVPGVSNASFLRLAYNKKAEAEGRDELDPLEFDDFIREKIKLVSMREEFLDRSLNEGFSGGEKKRNEILQMAVLEPKLAILDELDSGLDIDALRVLGDAVNKLQRADRALLIITHFPRILETIQPQFVHVLSGGRILKSSGKELAVELEERGYDWVLEEAAAGGAR
ncbi:ABC transporter ATP-binding protein [Geothrix limicola]|uniref:ABC transporter ATP-binding protein n=1 Tax=Geothrix limicola TaxID=2927978 RepID=A0ABQ5QFZ8_9BACT|nr:Fe-S cluster assembly ATPase SufC [Geothrix limicola]GLH73765.1 ABC transporter ATP-binding protein [Geothrix limicola]